MAIRENPVTERAAEQAGRRILLVEDNKPCQLTTKAMLQKMGLAVDTADNGFDALRLLHQQTYDLVIMDCQMPLMDGFQATEEWRFEEQHHPRARRTPIIALTSLNNEETRKRCLSSGMNDYLVKPATNERLVRALNTWLKSQPENRQPPQINTQKTAGHKHSHAHGETVDQPQLLEQLNRLQYLGLCQALEYGWRPSLIRHNDDHSTELLMIQAEGQSTAILQTDGTLRKTFHGHRHKADVQV